MSKDPEVVLLRKEFQKVYNELVRQREIIDGLTDSMPAVLFNGNVASKIDFGFLGESLVLIKFTMLDGSTKWEGYFRTEV